MVIESLVKVNEFEGIKYNYIYKLLKDKVMITYKKQALELECYGIEIERQDLKDNKIINSEKDFVKNISPQKYKVYNLLKMLYNNGVSPIHLIDVLGEYIDEYIIDFDDKINMCINY
ncbi:hypothetical protein D4Z93_01985 [Clostridium fermenticellae]|uniref:Uncharacterized protein n=1 Tax=Clostridium fermenticellae TaxID=2068654 RepID=A0A386H1D1_9CLOT|nr:DUF6514 family protein [Clostridium fermenticellae]AYD39375.1 hypothetical protein D4Z93_01985 [Clostridium fermenticellae]